MRAWPVLACIAIGVGCSQSNHESAKRVPRSDAYDHVFEAVVLVPDTTSGRTSIEIMRLKVAESAVTASEAVFLPPESEIDWLVESIAAESDGDYSQSLRGTRIDETHWECTLSTGGNTSRDISTYVTDGKTIVPVAYERHAVLRSERFVYSASPEPD